MRRCIKKKIRTLLIKCLNANELSIRRFLINHYLSVFIKNHQNISLNNRQINLQAMQYINNLIIFLPYLFNIWIKKSPNFIFCNNSIHNWHVYIHNYHFISFLVPINSLFTFYNCIFS